MEKIWNIANDFITLQPRSKLKTYLYVYESKKKIY